jgi:hypothetical protein
MWRNPISGTTVNPKLQHITATTRAADLRRFVNGFEMTPDRTRAGGSLRRLLGRPRMRPNRSNLTPARSGGA